MRKLSLVLIGLTIMGSAHAESFYRGGTGALFHRDTKVVHNTDLKCDSQWSRADQKDWDIPAPIYDLPEGGEYKLYRRSSEIIYYTVNGLIMAADDYFGGEVVFYDNGDVYLRNMIPSMLSGSYIKGTYADGKITVQFPQGLCYDNPFYDEQGNLITDSVWPVFRGKYEFGKVWDEEYEDYVETIDVWVDPDCQTITFTVNEDGSITQDDDETLVGVFTQGEIWYGEAAWNYKYLPFDEKPQILPEGLTADDWAFYDAYDAFMTQVAIDGDDIYWRGVYPPLGDSVVKGKIDGNKVYFESPTYLGVDPVSYHLAYFAGTETMNNWINIVTKPKFNYDADKQEITYPRKHVIVNSGPEKPNLIADYNSPTLHMQAEESELSNPLIPVIKWVSEFEYDEMIQMNSWFTVVDIPNIDVNGNLLNPERMWYNFYFDDDLFWFDATDYQLVQDSPDVPYTYTDDFNIWWMGNFQHYLYFYWTGYKTMGVQSVYESEDGTLYKSEMAVYKNPLQGGVGSVDTGATPVTEVYYDMMGRRVNYPKGLVIKQTTYSDGSVRTQKVVMK